MKYPNLIPLLLSWGHKGIQVLIPSDHYRCCLEHLATERRSHAVVERGIQVENLSSNSIRCPVMPCSFRGEYFHPLSSVVALIWVLIFPYGFLIQRFFRYRQGVSELQVRRNQLICPSTFQYVFFVIFFVVLSCLKPTNGRTVLPLL